MSTKDSGMRVRIERDLREAFVNACQAQGLGASEVLRDFMRSFAAKHSSEQAVLFGQVSKRTAVGAGKRGPR